MIKVKDIMTRIVITISPDATLADAIELLSAKKISGMPVVDTQEKVIGIITEKDILNFAFQFTGNLHSTRVKEAMSKDVVSFTSDTDVDKIALCFSKNEFRRIPIIDEGKLCGIISRRDLICSLLNHDYHDLKL